MTCPDAIVVCAGASVVIGVLWTVTSWGHIATRREECRAWERIEQANKGSDRTTAVGFCAPAAPTDDDET